MRAFLRLTPMMLAATLVSIGAPGCGDDDDDATPGTMDGASPDGGNQDGAAADGGVGDASAASAAVGSQAADLRVDLNLLLSEHLILAAKTTGAGLGARLEESRAYGALLSGNGTDLGAAIGSLYGAPAQTEFNRIWSAHNGFFVDYTTGVATNNEAAKTTALNNLNTVYVPEFAALLAGATALPDATLRALITEHVVTTKNIIDAQGAKDWTRAYTEIRRAFAHMQMVGDPLSTATVAKFPTQLPGSPDAKSVGFRVRFNELLQEHLYLATFATGAALAGRTDEVPAAIAALNANGNDLGAAVTSLYGEDAGREFNRIWSAHNGFFVEYTTGVATNDTAKRDKAVSDLTTMYVPQFAGLLATATGLPLATLTSLTMDHVVMTKAVVDAQAKTPVVAADATAIAAADRMAGKHMQMIGDPVAKAIVAKLPTQF